MTKKLKYSLVFCGVFLVYYCFEQMGVVSVYCSRANSSISEKYSSSVNSASNSPVKAVDISDFGDVCFEYPISRYFPFIKWGTTSVLYQSDAKDSNGSGSSHCVKYQASVVVFGVCSVSKFEDIAKKGFDEWLSERKNNVKRSG